MAVCPVALLLSGLAFPSLRRSNGYSVGARRGTGGRTLKAGITARIALKPMARRFSRLWTTQRDITLVEITEHLEQECDLCVAPSTVWRFFERHNVTFKKNRTRQRTRSA